MSIDDFRQRIAAGTPPPAGLHAPVLALWRDAAGDWDGAHAAAQSDTGSEGAWVHAYLHRKEGDFGNAAYWYRRAARPMPAATISLETEWEEIARTLLERT